MHLSHLQVLVALHAFFLTAVPASSQVGSVLRSHKINSADLGGLLEEDDYFGSAVAALGDLDGDGVNDLAVGASADYSPHPGAVWILFLTPTGAVRAFTRISRAEGGFTGALPDTAFFGYRVAAVGDLDGDRLTELAVFSFGFGGVGQVWILFLAADGRVKRHSELLYSDPVFQPPVGVNNRFGYVGALGDTDDDGLPDIAIGVILDDAGARNAGAFWIVRLNADGTAKSALKISQGRGGFTGPLERDSAFGARIRPLGDLDRDGNPELAVGAPGTDVSGHPSRGAYWILSLDSDEHVVRSVQLTSDDFFLPVQTLMASDVAGLGDLDEDGVGEIAVSLPAYWTGDPPARRDGFLIAFMGGDGTVRKRLVISHEQGGLGPLPPASGFGTALAPLGDLDGDGHPELAAGALSDGPDKGAVWILSLRASPIRNGTGVNPLTLSEKADPVIGKPWHAVLDCRAHTSGQALLAVYDRALAGLPTPMGELLVIGRRIALLQGTHAGTRVQFTALVPPKAALINLQLHAQALCGGAPGPHLSNALDMLVGR